MTDYIMVALNAWSSFSHYLVREVTLSTTPWYINYFWALCGISLIVFALELAFPWRKDQPRIRHDFFLDCFYMFFNFFFFKLIFMSPFSAVVHKLFLDLTGDRLQALSIIQNSHLPYPVQLLIFFLVLDFVQWLTHLLLHRIPFLWNFHKVHHSIQMMGFAGHLRYHWMENIIYTPVKYTAILLLGGFEPKNVFILYYFSILIGHLNHSNLNLSYGPLKYIFNNPVMHIWHHAKKIPGSNRYGVNYGISLSIWDYLFKTAWVKEDGRDITLGFNKMALFPATFLSQFVYPFKKL
jgi:sterol desaturase/sphingolipid hydroxylase (fatty acid hydroxylase superfamily)